MIFIRNIDEKQKLILYWKDEWDTYDYVSNFNIIWVKINILLYKTFY